jgi:hypothetical protein
MNGEVVALIELKSMIAASGYWGSMYEAIGQLLYHGQEWPAAKRAIWCDGAALM